MVIIDTPPKDQKILGVAAKASDKVITDEGEIEGEYKIIHQFARQKTFLLGLEKDK
jgi:hypothetical protein